MIRSCVQIRKVKHMHNNSHREVRHSAEKNPRVYERGDNSGTNFNVVPLHVTYFPSFAASFLPSIFFLFWFKQYFNSDLIYNLILS